MSNSNFDKNGLDESGFHWLQWAALIITCFAVWFGWAFFYDNSVHYLVIKVFKFWNCNGYNPLSYCVMRWKSDFYP